MRGRPRLEWANILRGVAAMSVVVWHLVMSFFLMPAGVITWTTRFPSSSQIPDWPVADFVAGIGFDLGAFGVTLFFLISGLVIARSLHSYSRSGFVVARAWRLLPTFAVGYLIACAAVSISEWIGFGRVSLTFGEVAWGLVPGLSLLTGQPSVPLGVDWTLIVEICFYLLCLILYRSLIRHRWVPVATAGLLVVAEQGLLRTQLLVGTPLQGVYSIATLVLPFLPLLLIGVVVAQDSDWRDPVGVGSIAVIFCAFLWMSQYTSPLSNFTGYRVTVLITTIGFLLVWRFGEKWRPHSVTSFFADISYPVYVIHLVVGYAIMVVLSATGLNPIVSVLAGLTGVTVLAWLVHRFVEVPTHRIGQRMARRISPSPAKPTAAGANS